MSILFDLIISSTKLLSFWFDASAAEEEVTSSLDEAVVVDNSVPVYIREIWQMTKRNPPFLSKDDLFVNVIMPDISRAVSCIGYLSEQALGRSAINFNRKQRPVLF